MKIQVSKKWYQDQKGETSHLRIITMMIVIVGICTVLSGLVGFFLKMSESVSLVSVGSAMVLGAEIGKVFQKKFEGINES